MVQGRLLEWVFDMCLRSVFLRPVLRASSSNSTAPCGISIIPHHLVPLTFDSLSLLFFSGLYVASHLQRHLFHSSSAVNTSCRCNHTQLALHLLNPPALRQYRHLTLSLVNLFPEASHSTLWTKLRRNPPLPTPFTPQLLLLQRPHRALGPTLWTKPSKLLSSPPTTPTLQSSCLYRIRPSKPPRTDRGIDHQ